MRWIAAILSLSLFTGPTLGADDPRRAQVAAATADAIGSLREDVLSAPVTPDISVEEFVWKTDSADKLAKALRRAEQIGGTRWLDDQTCQVRLELPGSEVAEALIEIAAADEGAAGLTADVLRTRVAGLREMTFAATGMSTNAIDRLRPPGDQVEWRGVPEAVIRTAVNDARRSAAQQVLESVQGIRLLGDAGSADPVFADRKVHDALEGWLMNRPVTSVEFGDDLEVRVAVAVTGEDFWNELAAAVGDRKDLPFPQDEEGVRALEAEVLRRVEPAVGRARAKDGAAGAARPAEREQIAIPDRPPSWVTRHVNGTGRARPVNGRLKTARAAETAARDDLGRQIAELSLTRKHSLGEAARQDDRVRDAIDRTVRRAKVRKVNYLADGSAEVSFALDLRELWQELDARR